MPPVECGHTSVGKSQRAVQGVGQGASKGVRRRKEVDLAAALITPVGGAMESTRRIGASAHLAVSRSPFRLESASPGHVA